MLRDLSLDRGSQNLCACSDDDSVRLRATPVAGVAGRVEKVGAIGVVQNGRTPVIAAKALVFVKRNSP
jgi:hypothetical protein